MRPILLALALLTACAPEASTPDVAPTPRAVWVDAAHPLYHAQAAWGLPLPFAPTVAELPGEDTNAACDVFDAPAGVGAHACVRGETIYLRAELPAELKARALVHELGHVYAGPDHIEGAECPTPAPDGRRDASG